MTTSLSDQKASPERDGASGGSPNDHRPPDSQATKKRGHGPRGPLWGNVLTILGAFTAGMAVILLMTFALFAVVSPSTNPYVDIVGYLILPTILITGLVLMPLGILFKSWRIKRYDPTQKLRFRFQFDLAQPGQRKLAFIFAGATFIFLPVVGVSSYHGYHYTDSSDFCGKACHAVMEPEATTYATSPHARVTCAECHIGAGAGWFVKSKLSGTRQVLAMWRETYSRPIPPAIHHLRPARETCEHCHWPEKFYGAQLKHFPHFAPDEKNTNRSVNLLLNIGGGHQLTGRVEGIHWHMALANSVEYIATDDMLQTIPWVRIVDRYDQEKIYRSDGRPSSDPAPEGQRRKFDCMDCHNRPAHHFLAPDEAVDRVLDGGQIDPDLPFIKREAIRVLTDTYESTESAEKRIGGELERFYKENYPDLWALDAKRVAVNRAIDGVRKIYRTNFFPYMKVDWRTYPDNIGHLNAPGCFRCHDNKHVNQLGETLEMDCDSCHSFLGRTVSDDGVTSYQTQAQYEHPWELVGVHKTLVCSDCHTGGALPIPSCTGCHSEIDAFRTAESAIFEPYSIEPDSMADAELDCETCHSEAEHVNLETMNGTCVDCHDDDESYDGMVNKWHDEINAAISDLEPRLSESDRTVLEALRRAGPAHNMEGARKILKALATGSSTATATKGEDRKPDSDAG